MQRCALGVTAALAFVLAGPALPQQIRWAPSYDAAIASAKAANKLVMVDFTMDTAPPCRKLDAEVLSDPMVADMSLQYAPVRIDLAKDAARLAVRYAVKVVPTILCINPETGDVQGRIDGYWQAGDFVAQLGRIARAHKEYASTLARYQADPNDAQTALAMLAMYASRGDKERAVQAMVQAAKDQASHETLAKACNDAGDSFQISGSPEQAISFFKGGASSKDPGTTAYADISIASCYRSLHRRREAVPYLKAILALNGAPQDTKESARQMLTEREVIVNGSVLPLAQVQALDGVLGVRIPDGVYWYDSRWGAWGLQGGQTEGFIRSGLSLGGALQSDASKGRSGVFANGRELPSADITQLRRYNIQPLPGRYWVDSNFTFGLDGGPALGNLLQIAGLQTGGQKRRSLLSGSFLTGMSVNSAGAVGREGESYTHK